MNQTEINEILLALLRCFLAGESFGGELTEEARGAVFALANKHDVAHLIAVVLERSGPLGKDSPFSVAKHKAIYRYVQQDYERQRICGAFETAQIPFIPLKGSVINALYPEPWQRTGCDIDILVRAFDLERAEDCLKEKLGFVFRKKSSHDVSLMSPGGVHLELHYGFDEREVVLDEVWCSAVPVQEGRMQYAMSGEQFLLHHIAHMAKHFRNGGCGLRPFVDLWFLREKMVHDLTELNALLCERGLGSFANAVFGLLEHWFAAEESTPLLEATANYILPAGVYGSTKNKVAIGQLEKGSKLNYFMSRLFQSRAALEYPYPALKKHGWLLPFCQVHRWYRLLADGKLNRITSELGANNAMDSAYRNDVGSLLKELELQ